MVVVWGCVLFYYGGGGFPDSLCLDFGVLVHVVVVVVVFVCLGSFSRVVCIHTSLVIIPFIDPFAHIP